MTQRTDDTPETHRPSRAATTSFPSSRAARSRREGWRIGTEHEKFVYRVEDHRAPSYDEPGGIRDLLMGLPSSAGSP